MIKKQQSAAVKINSIQHGAIKEPENNNNSRDRAPCKDFAETVLLRLQIL
jgi:hypothetical protein